MPTNLIRFPASSDPAQKKKPRKPKGLRADGTYQVVRSFGEDKDGKRVRKVFYGNTLSEATEKANEYARAVKHGLNVKGGEVTVREWAEEWLRTYKGNVSFSTKEGYKYSLKKINEHIGDMCLRDVRQVNLQGIANTVDGMSKSAVQKMKLTIDQVFGSAHDNQLILMNPARGVTYPSAEQKGHRALEPWERALIADNWEKHRAGIWAMMMLYTGMRCGELIALTWENVDFETGEIQVVDAAHFEGGKPVNAGRTKTKAGMRIVPMPGILIDALKRHLTSVPPECPYIAFSQSGAQLTQSALKRGWNGLLLALECIANGQEPEPNGDMGKRPNRIKEEQEKRLVKVKFDRHDLRHTYCTMLYTAGVDIKTAMQYMGHDDMQTTSQIYTHLDNEKERASRTKLEEYINKTFSATT